MSRNYKKLKISIITINLNNKLGLRKTLNSIKHQTYQNFQHILVDGYSTDGSREVINENKNLFSKLIFKKGTGVYPAINQCLKKTKGDVICLLHSGDKFSNKNVLNYISEKFSNSKIDVLFSGTRIIKNKKVFRLYRGNSLKKWDLRLGLSPPHLSTFVTSDVIKKIGLYDINFKIASDFNFFVKLYKLKNLKFIVSKKNLVDMEHGGKSNQGLKSIYNITKEIKMVLKKNNIYSNYFFIILRIFFKLKQMINVK